MEKNLAVGFIPLPHSVLILIRFVFFKYVFIVFNCIVGNIVGNTAKCDITL